MTPSEAEDIAAVKSLVDLLAEANNQPIGDLLVSAMQIFESIDSPVYKSLAEEALRGLRRHASRAQIGDAIFAEAVELTTTVDDEAIVQLFTIERALHELCYCFERVEESSIVTSGGSTPTRFYLNSMYHYVSSMFLIDTSRPSHQDLPMGGTVIKALYPINLYELLIPIKEILEMKFGESTFGDAILKLRHSYLVHGDFSPSRIEYLVQSTNMRNPMQQERFANLMWRLFHRLILFDLKLVSILSSLDEDVRVVLIRYFQTISN